MRKRGPAHAGRLKVAMGRAAARRLEELVGELADVRDARDLLAKRLADTARQVRLAGWGWEDRAGGPVLTPPPPPKVEPKPVPKVRVVMLRIDEEAITMCGEGTMAVRMANL